MAIDFGTSNTTRYYSIPDHADLTLPNGDWAWITLVYPQDSTKIKNIVSTGPFGFTNTINMLCYDSANGFGFAAKVGGLTEIKWSGPADVPMDKWYWFYATRRSNQLYVGSAPVGDSSANEGTPTAISAAYDSGIDLSIGRRDAITTRNWLGRWGQAAFVSGAGITAAQAVELARGTSLLNMPFAPSLKFLLHGKNASDATITDLISGKIATKQGAGYGTDENDAQTPYVWSPEHVRGVAAASGHNLTGSASTQANASSAAGIIQDQELAGSTSTLANASGAGAITLGAVNTLFGAASALSSASSTGVITQTQVLTASTSTNGGTSSAVAITQVQVLAGADSTQDNPGGTGAISTASEFTGAPSAQANLSGVGQVTRTQTLSGANSAQANLSGMGTISDGIVFEAALTTGIAETMRVKKPGIPAGTPEWLRTILEILVGRRGNKIGVPKFQDLSFSATPTKAECERLYAYINSVRGAVEQLISRMDG